MKFTAITLFPQIIETFASEGLIAQAQERGLLSIATVNPRQYTSDVHQTVDDRVFGGSDGMAMKVEPLAAAVRALEPGTRVAVLTPQGRVWRQADAERWAREGSSMALVCGRYAGIDHRFSVRFAAEEISIGDFILNGGEVAACAVIESIARLLPGVLGNRVSAVRDSFGDGWLECPQFTRPREIEGLPVPSPLLSGHHAEIEAFSHSVARLRTALLRPDLVSEVLSLSADVKRVGALSDLELLSLGLNRDNLEKLRQEWP